MQGLLTAVMIVNYEDVHSWDMYIYYIYIRIVKHVCYYVHKHTYVYVYIYMYLCICIHINMHMSVYISLPGTPQPVVM